MSAKAKTIDTKVNVIVVKEFIDRYTGILHKQGEKMSISTVRFREINRLCEYVKTEKMIAAEKAASDHKK